MTLGRFCWYDLISVDPDKSLKFLHDFLKIEGKTSPDYRELSINGQFFGGLMKSPDPNQKESAWVGYLHVADLKESTDLAEQLGATVPMREMEIPKVGKFSFLKDPQGAFVYLFQPSIPMDAPKMQPGMVCWCELRTQDPHGSAEFYGRLLGYETRSIPNYTMLQLKGKDVAGMVEDKQRTGWLFYFLVENARESAAQAKKLGATERQAPIKVEGWGTMAVLSEPTGAAMALWEPEMARAET